MYRKAISYMLYIRNGVLMVSFETKNPIYHAVGIFGSLANLVNRP